MKCGTFRGYEKAPTVRALNHVWEYVAGSTYIAVRMSPESPDFSPEYSFVMARKSDDLDGDVKQEIERRAILWERKANA